MAVDDVEHVAWYNIIFLSHFCDQGTILGERRQQLDPLVIECGVPHSSLAEQNMVIVSGHECKIGVE